jgi:hypothetical protein
MPQKSRRVDPEFLAEVRRQHALLLVPKPKAPPPPAIEPTADGPGPSCTWTPPRRETMWWARRR